MKEDFYFFAVFLLNNTINLRIFLIFLFYLKFLHNYDRIGLIMGFIAALRFYVILCLSKTFLRNIINYRK